MASGFVVLVPLKRWQDGKSRLVPPPGVERAALVRAFAMDTLEAVRGSAAVRHLYVVTAEPEPHLRGVSLLEDRGGQDLNRALALAADEVVTSLGAVPVAVVCGDLPALRSEDLTTALTEAATSGRRCFVTDAAGTGTTLLAAPTGAELGPSFGRDSARLHAASGASPIGVAVPSLRRDVDTAADLAASAALGLGRHTAKVLRT
jgi:2-phospho-L-lactate/phosphoenolpyruvate guanylyltransferase